MPPYGSGELPFRDQIQAASSVPRPPCPALGMTRPAHVIRSHGRSTTRSPMRNAGFLATARRIALSSEPPYLSDGQTEKSWRMGLGGVSARYSSSDYRDRGSCSSVGSAGLNPKFRTAQGLPEQKPVSQWSAFPVSLRPSRKELAVVARRQPSQLHHFRVRAPARDCQPTACDSAVNKPMECHMRHPELGREGFLTGRDQALGNSPSTSGSS